jgi:hypothetical protein
MDSHNIVGFIVHCSLCLSSMESAGFGLGHVSGFLLRICLQPKCRLRFLGGGYDAANASVSHARSSLLVLLGRSMLTALLWSEDASRLTESA